MRTPLDRFWAKVDKDGPIAKNTPERGRCWLWLGAKTPKGYGYFGRNYRHVYAHRFAYETFVGPIPEGRQLDHFACDRTDCCNPSHVRPVTARENVLRSSSPAADQASRMKCPHGHPYDEANTYWHRGHRQCRACRDRRNAISNARRKEVVHGAHS